MKINQNFLFWVALSFVSIVFFQNCGQQGDIALKLEDDASDTLVQDICSVNPDHVRCTNENPTGKVEEYRYIDVKQPLIPDLKIFLVLDNSDSMRVSQVNLVNNIEKMFNANGEGLKDYNSEIFIITTAQLNNINNALFRAKINDKNGYQKVVEKIYEISSVQYVQNLIQIFRPGTSKTSGLLEGDLVGFKAKSSRIPSSIADKFDEFNLSFYPAYFTSVDQPNIVSIKYSKGESIQTLVDRLKARVEFLDPDRQEFNSSINFDGSNVDNVPLSEVVEKESGLCAMARVLHEVKNNPESSLIKKGELATFILVSDEKEHDPQGLECVKSYKFQQPLPGNLYRGECVDTDSTVSYKVPDLKTVTFNVAKPYLKHIRQVYETIKPEVTKRDGKCAVDFNRSYARLKIWKNSHSLKFDRRVLDADGNPIISSWKNELKFKRTTLKHFVEFQRSTLSHKVKFDRVTKRFNVKADRTKIQPKYSINIDRKKIAKYQKVAFSRKTVLIKEGGGTETPIGGTTYAPAAFKVYNVNIPTADCTVDWLRSIPVVKAAEATLPSSPKQEYRYTISQCVAENVETLDPKTLEVFGVKPVAANCNKALAQVLYPEPALEANESMEYKPVTCGDVASLSTLVKLNVTNVGPAPASCTGVESAASNVDLNKPSIDAGLGETLEYKNVVCASGNGVDLVELNVEIKDKPGNYSAAVLLDYIVGLDGNKLNTAYVNTSFTNTPSLPSAVVKSNLIDGPIPVGVDANAYAKLKDNKDNIAYSSAVIKASNVELSTSIIEYGSKYVPADNAALLAYVKQKDGSLNNTEYSVLSVVNTAQYIDSKGDYAFDGKAPTCNLDYAKSKDDKAPALQAGQSYSITGIACVDSKAAHSLVRGSTTIKYDGTYNIKAMAFERLDSNGRLCDATERDTLLNAEKNDATTPLQLVSGVIELDSEPCKISNVAVTNSTVLNAINALTSVKEGATDAVCTEAFVTKCTDNTYQCVNKNADFIAYRPFEAEARRYYLQPPILEGQTLHWFGFEPVKITTSAGVQTIDLKDKKCNEVPGTCVGATDQTIKVSTYIAATFPGASPSAVTGKTVTDSTTIPACNSAFGGTGYTECRDLSKGVSDLVSYDVAAGTQVTLTGALDANISCDSACTATTCLAKTGSLSDYSGKTLKQFYTSAYCAVASTAPSVTVATRNTASISLSQANSNLAAFQNDADVCDLKCSTSGLCKMPSGPIDISDITVKQFLAAKNQNIDVSKITSCKIQRNAVVAILGKSSSDAVDTACLKPAGTVLPNKYVRNKMAYYDADPAPINQVSLVKENAVDLESYIKANFDNVLGDGYVNMVSFSSKISDGGQVEGAEYNRVAESVNGLVKDVKASSTEYGEALKFLGEKVAAQLASSFKVADVAESQKVTRVWYSSWFTKGKFVELKPTDYSASASSFVVTNPEIVEKMKNEAAFKFFVEIY